MIRSFRHKGLQRLFEDDDPRGVNPQHVRKLRHILAALNGARMLEGLNLPTFNLHPLKGTRAGSWAVTVRANWRVVFRFENGGAFDVDYEDYH
jgi:proteic killer suppression protein